MSWGVLEEVVQIPKMILEMIESKRLLLGFNKLKTTWQCNLLLSLRFLQLVVLVYHVGMKINH